MSEINRRRFLTRALASGGGLLLAGCDRLSRSEGFVDVLSSVETLNDHVHHLITSRTSMAQEFSEADLSPMFRSNGTANPENPGYQALAANGFSDYRLNVTGQVETPKQFSLAELRMLDDLGRFENREFRFAFFTKSLHNLTAERAIVRMVASILDAIPTRRS